MKVKLKPIDQQVVVIFGASSGIGRLAAMDFAARGAKVVAAARGEAGLQSLVAEIKRKGGDAFYVIADAADFEQVDHVAKEGVRRYGRLDTWVHTAGTIIFARFEDTTPDEFKRLIEVNLLGQVYGAQAALPHLKRAGGGALIHLTSVEAFRSVPLHSAYGSSKHGVSGFLESLRVELKHENIPVSVTEIMPAAINTPIWETGLNKIGYEIQTPVPPTFHPQIVVDAILFAAENPIRDFVAGITGLGVTLSERISPHLADRITALLGYRQVGTDETKPNAPHNLYEPVTEKDTVEGGATGWRMAFDPYTWVRTHPFISGLLMFAACGVAGGLLAHRTLNKTDNQN